MNQNYSAETPYLMRMGNNLDGMRTPPTHAQKRRKVKSDDLQEYVTPELSRAAKRRRLE
jgi:hypothetical protein